MRRLRHASTYHPNYYDRLKEDTTTVHKECGLTFNHSVSLWTIGAGKFLYLCQCFIYCSILTCETHSVRRSDKTACGHLHLGIQSSIILAAQPRAIFSFFSWHFPHYVDLTDLQLITRKCSHSLLPVRAPKYIKTKHPLWTARYR